MTDIKKMSSFFKLSSDKNFINHLINITKAELYNFTKQYVKF